MPITAIEAVGPCSFCGDQQRVVVSPSTTSFAARAARICGGCAISAITALGYDPALTSELLAQHELSSALADDAAPAHEAEPT